ncbi:MAG: peptidyl-alpha-hydroxyglycine alpha-amidating lyase family protein [Limnochordia bacterium]|jgi:DNA-binding beta-propeller fold protein YncE
MSFQPVEGWGQLPPGLDLVEVSGIGVDSQDWVYVFNRGSQPVVLFDGRGNYLGPWAPGAFKRPHSLFITAAGEVYCVDDGGHAVYRMDREGNKELSLEMGPSDTGFIPGDYFSVRYGGPPFNQPTDVAVAPTGEIYVTDGYGNARVHKFSSTGEHLLSWGGPGEGKGQFRLPHGICIDGEGLVYVADRENSRIQIFDPEGNYLTQWSSIRRPNQLRIGPDGLFYVAELGYVFTFQRSGADFSAPRARVTVRDRQGRILASVEEEDPYWAPHGLALDSQGHLYVGSVNRSFSRRTAPEDTVILRKYQPL